MVGHEGKEEGLSVVPWHSSLPYSPEFVEGEFSEVHIQDPAYRRSYGAGIAAINPLL